MVEYFEGMCSFFRTYAPLMETKLAPHQRDDFRSSSARNLAGAEVMLKILDQRSTGRVQ